MPVIPYHHDRRYISHLRLRSVPKSRIGDTWAASYGERNRTPVGNDLGV